jgi:steroid 5-alpha reductase family enzyme
MLVPMRSNIRDSRAAGVVISAATYLVAFAAAVAVVKAVGPLHPLLEVGLGTLTATVVVFAVSVATDNSSVYDPYWSLQPLAIAGYYLWTGRGVGPRDVLVTVLVFLYALRLTANFYRGWPGLSKEDFRYEEFRRRTGRLHWPVSFFGIHLFPTVMVYLGCLPLYAVAWAPAGPLRWLDALAALVVAGAIALAFVADEQLRGFRRDPRNRGQSIRTGLWARSRHPNYLGEICTWWGLWVFALAAGAGWWWTGVGALAITVMFVVVSVPMMEKRALASRAGYADYRRSTPMLLPRLRLRPQVPEAGRPET